MNRLLNSHSDLARYKNRHGLNPTKKTNVSLYASTQSMLREAQQTINMIASKAGVRVYCTMNNVDCPAWVRKGDTFNVQGIYNDWPKYMQRRWETNWKEDQTEGMLMLIRVAIKDTFYWERLNQSK